MDSFLLVTNHQTFRVHSIISRAILSQCKFSCAFFHFVYWFLGCSYFFRCLEAVEMIF